MTATHIWTPVSTDPTTEHASFDHRYARVSPYSIASGFNWQVSDKTDLDIRISGSAPDRATAKKLAEHHLHLPDAEFRRLVIAELTEKLREIERSIQRIYRLQDRRPRSGRVLGLSEGALLLEDRRRALLVDQLIEKLEHSEFSPRQ
jgi:hypothetical protein